MYEELLRTLRSCPDAEYGCSNCQYQKALSCREKLMNEAADAIEKLNRYAAQMDKLSEDGWYLLQETAGTYGPITMKMPIPEPLSCDNVLAIINGEPPKEELE